MDKLTRHNMQLRKMRNRAKVIMLVIILLLISRLFGNSNAVVLGAYVIELLLLVYVIWTDMTIIENKKGGGQ